MDWLAGVVAAALGTWLAHAMGWVLPLPSRIRVQLALRNIWQRKAHRPCEGFRVVVCWLEGDRDGGDTRIVADVFTEVAGIQLARSARVVKAPPDGRDAWIGHMQREARKLLSAWNADLVVAGVVRKSGEILNLWVVPAAGRGTLGRADRPYALEGMTLGRDFRDDFRQQLISTALVAVAPLADLGTRGQVLAHGLKDATAKLECLLAQGGTTTVGHRGSLHFALGNALATLGELETEPERLVDAVAAYRASLEDRTRECAPLEWAHTLNNLAGVLTFLGRRERCKERFDEAVAALHASLEERSRKRTPLQWAATQTNLGAALLARGELDGSKDHLVEAVDANLAALEELPRESCRSSGALFRTTSAQCSGYLGDAKATWNGSSPRWRLVGRHLRCARRKTCRSTGQ